MDLVLAGLGRMGANMARRLHGAGHHVVTYNRSEEKVREIMAEGLDGALSAADAVAKLPVPRVVWLMVPAGDATEATMEEFAALLSPGDTIVDGGNANFKDSKRRHALLAERGIKFVDAGISGGVWGLQNGYGTMVGGEPDAVEPLEPVFRALAPEGGYIHCGPSGSGHYTKMVHNGIEYGLMQAYAEGFEILHAGEYPLDTSRPWPRPGSTARSSARGCWNWPAMPSPSGASRSRACVAGSPTLVRDAGRCRKPWTLTCLHQSSRSRS